MNSPELDRLIRNSLDGTATADETARLDATLASSDAARRRHHELLALFQTLQRVPLADPPADLQSRVLAALPSTPPARIRIGWLEALREGLSGPPVARLGFTFAAGLAAGAIAFAAWNGTLTARTSGDLQHATGTLSPAPKAGAALDWQLGEAAVRVANPDPRRLLVEIAGSGDAEVSLECAAPGFGASAVRSSRPASSHVLLEPGRVRLSGAAGTVFELEIPEAASPGMPLHVTARSGESRAEDDLPVRGRPGIVK